MGNEIEEFVSVSRVGGGEVYLAYGITFTSVLRMCFILLKIDNGYIHLANLGNSGVKGTDFISCSS